MRKPKAVPIPHSYWVEPQRFLAGEHPGSTNQQYAHDTVGALLRAGIRTFIDLTEEPEWVAYAHVLHQEAGRYDEPLEYWRRALPDRQISSIEHMRETLTVIDSALAAGRAVYVHCLAGIGRTGTVVGCYLVRHGMSGADALQALAQLRRFAPDAAVVSPETEEQRQFVRLWQPGT
jgi:protein-tyrosine phosphatase